MSRRTQPAVIAAMPFGGASCLSMRGPTSLKASWTLGWGFQGSGFTVLPDLSEQEVAHLFNSLLAAPCRVLAKMSVQGAYSKYIDMRGPTSLKTCWAAAWPSGWGSGFLFLKPPWGLDLGVGVCFSVGV